MSSTKLLDSLIVVDLECTCWEDKPHSEDMEIIEIGISKIKLTDYVIESSESIIVKPEYSDVSEFCTKLTTLTQEDVDKGCSLQDACQYIQDKYQCKIRTWGSWGDFDREQFQMECNKKGVIYPFGKTHINISNLFAIKHGLNKQLSVDKAFKHIGCPFEGTPHRGIDDALNIAKLFRETMFAMTPFRLGQHEEYEA